MKKLCIVPWISIEVSPMGDAKPCCLAKEIIPESNLLNSDLTSAFNSTYMQNLRQEFIDGKQPSTCERCWNEEAAGRKSKRLNMITRLNHLIKDVDFTKTTSDKLITLDLKLGNICNLKCRICGSFSSSKWAQEEIDIDPRNLQAKENLRKGQWPRKNNAFWEDLNELLPYIRYMDFTGGEPFLIDEHFDLLQQAVDRGLAGNIEIHYNTNTTTVPKRGLELWPHFKLIEIALSIDDVGERFEYQRYGAYWDQTLKNLDTFRSLRDNNENITLQLCTTINVQNVYYLDTLVKWIEQQKFDSIYFNVLHTIWYFSVRSLNDEAKKLVSDKFTNLQLPYQEDIDGIIKFMNQGKSTDCSKLIKILKNSDLQRKQSFADTHPEMAKAIGYA